jgi:hypothetical protein
MVSALGSLVRKGFDVELILPVLKRISSNKNEDYRIKEEAKLGLMNYKRTFPLS